MLKNEINVDVCDEAKKNQILVAGCIRKMQHEKFFFLFSIIYLSNPIIIAELETFQMILDFISFKTDSDKDDVGLKQLFFIKSLIFFIMTNSIIVCLLLHFYIW